MKRFTELETIDVPLGRTVKDGVIELQGDHCDKVQAKLTELRYKVKRAGARYSLIPCIGPTISSWPNKCRLLIAIKKSGQQK